MKILHIENSYRIWSIDHMTVFLMDECATNYGTIFANDALNRSWTGMFIEWWLHNIGYWITLPFVKSEKIRALNERFKHVDLEEHK